jgi:hypothetical protein
MIALQIARIEEAASYQVQVAFRHTVIGAMSEW